jgi:peroxiredoxin
MGEKGPEKLSTNDLFGGKKVAFFALPGAFTPTCSAQHVPSYVKASEEMAGKGIDAIVCTSVNDAFVMGAWSRDQGAAGKVDFIADGNGDFARAVGLAFDGSGFGMGERSQRYSMIVSDGVVEQLNVEQPGAYEVSSAEHMLKQL